MVPVQDGKNMVGLLQNQAISQLESPPSLLALGAAWRSQG